MIRTVAAGALAIIAMLGAASPGEAKSWAPRNACSKVPGADDFRLALATAVANRNADMLSQLALPEVLLDFGGGSGRAQLISRLDDPDYMLWDELDTVLALGCAPVAAEGTGIALPWIWRQDVKGVDATEGMLALGPDVPMRSAPSDDAKLVKSLDWQALQLVGGWDPDAEYLEVSQPGGPTGFVRQDQMRSLISYRLLAEPVDGKWQITAFVAGD